ncbi:hypothetical protein AWB69_00907 [Caballeronia udeis]|uniref:Zinc-ribbon domain-containing protein n=2 Tax=Caballeronia udeis TaxID=1232866 RepID=A0A158FBK0_9BURK|nr:hypothetical protein AWB69_00907 [Caballeronia udeis]
MKRNDSYQAESAKNPEHVDIATATQPAKRTSNARLTIGEMHVIAAGHKGRCLSLHFVNTDTHLEWECAEGHRWLAIPSSVKSGTWCGICSRECPRVPLTEVRRVAEERGGRCLASKYVNGTTPLLFECASGHRWKAQPALVRVGHWCPQCLYASRRGTIGKMQEIAESRGGQRLSEVYVDQRRPLRWRCASGHEWESSANSVQDHRYPYCMHERLRTGIGRMHEIAATHGGRCLSESYAGTNTRLEWQCATDTSGRWRLANLPSVGAHSVAAASGTHWQTCRR